MSPFSTVFSKDLYCRYVKTRACLGKGEINFSARNWNLGRFHCNIIKHVCWYPYFKPSTHSHTMTPFDAPGKQTFWKHPGKRRNCSYWAISPLPTVFSTRLEKFLLFSSNSKLLSADCFTLNLCKILSSGNGLKTSFTTLVASKASVDEDQAAQDVQFDLWAILPTLLNHWR